MDRTLSSRVEPPTCRGTNMEPTDHTTAEHCRGGGRAVAGRGIVARGRGWAGVGIGRHQHDIADRIGRDLSGGQDRLDRRQQLCKQRADQLLEPSLSPLRHQRTALDGDALGPRGALRARGASGLRAKANGQRTGATGGRGVPHPRDGPSELSCSAFVRRKLGHDLVALC